jgi:hypothetical protein
MTAFDWNSFVFGFFIGSAGMQLFFLWRKKRSEKEYQDCLARCCKSCGGLLEPGEVCECLAFTEKEHKDQEK